MSDERKLVTVLFADIVGSTALTTSHQPEVVREVLSQVFASLSEVIQRHGGTVEKFIGDEIMAVFGAPAAHEDDVLLVLDNFAQVVEPALPLEDRRARTTAAPSPRRRASAMSVVATGMAVPA